LSWKFPFLFCCPGVRVRPLADQRGPFPAQLAFVLPVLPKPVAFLSAGVFHAYPTDVFSPPHLSRAFGPKTSSLPHRTPVLRMFFIWASTPPPTPPPDLFINFPLALTRHRPGFPGGFLLPHSLLIFQCGRFFAYPTVLSASATLDLVVAPVPSGRRGTPHVVVCVVPSCNFYPAHRPTCFKTPTRFGGGGFPHRSRHGVHSPSISSEGSTALVPPALG